MDRITTTKPITRQGNCLAINVSKECKILGVDRGDIVEVTIEKKVDKPIMVWKWGIFDKDGNLDTDPEPMIFDTRKDAMEVLGSDAYDSADGYYVDSYLIRGNEE